VEHGFDIRASRPYFAWRWRPHRSYSLGETRRGF
jgi:hypothetical protein